MTTNAGNKTHPAPTPTRDETAHRHGHLNNETKPTQSDEKGDKMKLFGISLALCLLITPLLLGDVIGTGYVMSDVGLRSQPEVADSFVFILSKWDTVQIVEERDDWILVRREAKEGWIEEFSMRIIEITDPATIVQDSICGEIISSDYDRVTGITKTGMSEPLWIARDEDKGEGMAIHLFAQEVKFPVGVYSAISITIGIMGGGCIDDDDKAFILFRDGSRLELKNEGDFNCDGIFKYSLIPAFSSKGAERFKLLSSKEIEILRVWTSTGSVEEEFTPEQSKIVMTAIDCLSKY